jgi:Asp/Glu/hydantoin racemase
MDLFSNTALAEWRGTGGDPTDDMRFYRMMIATEDDPTVTTLQTKQHSPYQGSLRSMMAMACKVVRRSVITLVTNTGSTR